MNWSFSKTTDSYIILNNNNIQDKEAKVSIDNNVVGIYSSPDEVINFDYSRIFQGWNNNFFVGAVLKDKVLYFANREGGKNLTAVWKLDLVENTAVNITENLTCLDKLGRPGGKIGSLVANQDKTKLYLSTEEGIFERAVDGTNWTKIKSYNGNLQLFLLEDNTLVAIDVSTEEYKLFLQIEDTFIKLPPIKLATKIAIQNASKKDNTLKLYFRTRNTASLDITNVQPTTYNKPSVATYLNLKNVSAVCNVETTIYLANDYLWKVDSLGNKEQILYTSGVVRQILNYKEEIILLYDNKIVKVVDGTEQVLTYISPNNNLKLVTDNNIIVLINGTTITVFDSEYNVVSTLDTKVSYLHDVAIQGDYIYAGGFNNKRRRTVPVQVAFLRKYELVGSELKAVATLWDYSGEVLDGNMADTRIYNLAISGDELYVLGESAGGNTIYRWNAEDLSTHTLITSDIYDTPYNSKSAHILYYGVIDLNTFTLRYGQFSIPRGAKMLSNSNRARSLSVSSDKVYIGSKAAYSIESRDESKWLGDTIAPYNEGDAALLCVSKTLEERVFWLTPGSGEVLLFNEAIALIQVENKGEDTAYIRANSGTMDSDLPNNVCLIVW